MFDYNKQILLQLVSLNGDGLSKTDKLSEDNIIRDYISSLHCIMNFSFFLIFQLKTDN